MKAQPRVAILLGVLLLGSGHAAAAEFPVPPDVQWEAIKYPAGYGCGLFAENQAQKGKGWFISGSAPAAEAECRKSCEAQIIKAQADTAEKACRSRARALSARSRSTAPRSRKVP